MKNTNLMMQKNNIEHILNEFTKIKNLYKTKKFEKVIEKTFLLLKKDPNQVSFYNYIGLSYRQIGKLDNAEKIFQKGLVLFPNSLSIICNLGSLYRVMLNYDKAESFFQRALKIKQDDFNTLCNYGNLKRDLNQNQQAIDFYIKALEINNHNQALLINLASAYQIEGDFDSSKKILKTIHLKFPENTKADFMYSSIHDYTENDDHRNKMLDKLKLNNEPQEIIHLYFAIAKSYSDVKDYSESANYFIKANRAQYKLFSNYNFKNELFIFNEIKNRFNNLELKKHIDKKPNLIFIVGMPRSGTTLTHQIISSHSEVFGGGEMLILGKILNKKIIDNKFLDNFFKNQDFTNNIFVNNFANEIKKMFLQFSDKIILDKSPLNFIWIGFIKILFPNAKIIHCKRNLRDVALSIYKNSFEAGSLPWSYNDENLVAFIEAYKDLMNIWHEKFPNQIYDCDYEKLVNNQVNETRKMIEFCNLEWDEKCIDHTKNNTSIKTVSIYQARKPIYKSSIKLSDNYLKYLSFLNKL